MHALDRLASLAARLAGTPIALVSVLHEDHNALPGVHGVPPELEHTRRLPLAFSFCRHVIAADAPVAIEDLRADERTRENPAIDAFGLGAYLGVPLRPGGGPCIGAVCAFAADRRTWSADDVAVLEDLARFAGDELELADRVADLEALTDQLPVVLYRAEWGPVGRVLTSISPRIEEWTGAPAQAWIDDPEHWRSVVHPDDRARVAAEGERSVRDGVPFELEYRLVGPGGRIVRVWAHEVLVRDDAGRVVSSQGVITDVTALREAQDALATKERRLAHLAMHDALTGLPNRQALLHRLSLALDRARRRDDTAAVLFLDLDQFKVVNDSLGHAGGDLLLSAVAARLQGLVRPGDVVARHGGDEFLVLLDGLGPDPRRAAEATAARVLAALEAPFDLGGSPVDVGASIGISLFPADGSEPEELLRHADAAMLEAKRTGRGAAAVYEPGRDDAHRELSLTGRLRRAVERDELVLHFQPIFDLASGRPVSVEALVRWQDPERGLVGPGAFIPHAEEHGLIDRIGSWVLEHACAQLAAWRADGIRTTMSVNVAVRQLHRDGFVPGVAATAIREGVDPGRLILEVTESTAMADPSSTEPLLSALRELGVRIAIDDFGAGHSSLGRLRELPVDVLKVDRSFLDGVPSDPGAAALVSGILTLGGALDLTTVVEGIETEEQRAFLVEHGGGVCGQGFGLARPAPADAIAPVLLAAALSPA